VSPAPSKTPRDQARISAAGGLGATDHFHASVLLLPIRAILRMMKAPGATDV
jgi:hypothetical protein